MLCNCAVMPGPGFKNVYNHLLRRSNKVAGPTPLITRPMRFSTLAVLFTAVSATYALPLHAKTRRDLLAILVCYIHLLMRASDPNS